MSAIDKDKASSNDWEGYYRAVARNDEFHRDYLSAYSRHAYEYGVLSIKHFTLMAGGALVALPAIVSMSPTFPASVAADAGLFFALALVASLFCTYSAHINWSINYNLREEYRSRDMEHLAAAYLPGTNPDVKEEAEFKKLVSKKNRMIWWTWILSHITGLTGFGTFFTGCWILYQGMNLIGATK